MKKLSQKFVSFLYIVIDKDLDSKPQKFVTSDKPSTETKFSSKKRKTRNKFLS
jgi:hypothetical protein